MPAFVAPNGPIDADPRQLAIVQAAGSLFRGAGYTVFDGSAPDITVQAAVGAPQAHATAPLRRLVDRFVLVTCEALVAGHPVLSWVRDALPSVPAIMSASDAVASRLDRGSIDVVEAAVLRGRVGEVSDATVISAGRGGGVIQLVDPAVAAEYTGPLDVGSRVRVTVVTADIPTSTVRLSASAPQPLGRKNPQSFPPSAPCTREPPSQPGVEFLMAQIS